METVPEHAQEPPLTVPLMARTRRVQPEDPLRFLAARGGQPRFYFRSAGFALAGAGIATDLRGDGPERLERVRDEAARIHAGLGVEREPGVPAGTGPLWIGGIAFEASPEGAEARLFPGARFVLPVEQLRIQSDGAYLTRVQPVRAATRPAETSPRVATEGGAAGPDWSTDVDEGEWARRVRAALHAIREGALEKVVLSRSLHAAFARVPDLTTALGRFQNHAPNSHVFMIEPEPDHAWLGASPEILVRRGNGRLETAAVAGSRPRGSTPEDDAAQERSLRASSKEAWEHELVCRALRARLSEGGRDWSVTQDRGVLKLPHVQHLETRFEAPSPRGEHVLDWAARLHPTPAVSGAPRDASLAFLAATEGRGRGWYGGAVGVFDAEGDGELVVAIRSAHVQGARVRLTAGCGIVNGSDPAEEWSESQAKLRLARDAFEGGGPPR